MAESVSLPWVASSTMGLVPFASLGSRCSSRSTDFVEPVPASVRSSEVSEPAMREASTSTTVRAIHAPMTHQWRRAQNLASLCSAPVTNPFAGRNLS